MRTEPSGGCWQSLLQSRTRTSYRMSTQTVSAAFHIPGHLPHMLGIIRGTSEYHITGRSSSHSHHLALWLIVEEETEI